MYIHIPDCYIKVASVTKYSGVSSCLIGIESMNPFCRLQKKKQLIMTTTQVAI
jgi:hypothetical protein